MKIAAYISSMALTAVFMTPFATAVSLNADTIEAQGKVGNNIFGGNFFAQIENEADADEADKYASFLPRVANMSDEVLLAELAKLEGIDEDEMFAEFDNKPMAEREDVCNLIRTMVELKKPLLERDLSK